MTMTKILLLLTAFLLLSVSCYAEQDLNTMTPAELQDYVQDLQAQASTPTPIQPTVITIQADTQLNEKMTLLQSELASVKVAMTQMQERFNRLATDTGEKIASGNADVIKKVDENSKTQLTELYKEITDYIDQKTNPIRQNAPAVGAFLILAGAFLLWASRQYKLTNRGEKHNG